MTDRKNTTTSKDTQNGNLVVDTFKTSDTSNISSTNNSVTNSNSTNSNSTNSIVQMVIVLRKIKYRNAQNR